MQIHSESRQKMQKISQNLHFPIFFPNHVNNFLHFQGNNFVILINKYNQNMWKYCMCMAQKFLEKYRRDQPFVTPENFR